MVLFQHVGLTCWQLVQEMQRDLEAKRASRDGLEAELLAERSAGQAAAAAAEAREDALQAFKDELAGVQVAILLGPAKVLLVSPSKGAHA